MAASISAIFEHTPEKTYKACLSGIATLGYRISNSQKDCGIISFETGVSLWSLGQKLTCTIIELSNNQTEVIISAIPKGIQIYDWGESKTISKKVLRQIDIILN